MSGARSFRFFGRDGRAVAGDVGGAEDDVVEKADDCEWCRSCAETLDSGAGELKSLYLLCAKVREDSVSILTRLRGLQRKNLLLF